MSQSLAKIDFEMPTYEMMIIFDSDAEEEERHPVLSSLEEIIKGLNGSITHTELWGMRQFAYEINHKKEGFYLVFEFEAQGELTELDRILRLSDIVVRHKTMRLPDFEAERRSSIRSGATEDVEFPRTRSSVRAAKSKKVAAERESAVEKEKAAEKDSIAEPSTTEQKEQIEPEAGPVEPVSAVPDA